jgi:Cu+-exporting ATPase
MVASGRGAAAGVLIKGGEPLERLASADTVVLDKTGTLTEGRPRVEAVVFAPGVDEHATLAWITSAERRSEHPLAAAIVEFGNTKGVVDDSVSITDFRAVPGKGVRVRVNGAAGAIGTEAFLQAEQADATALHAVVARWAGEGRTPVLAALDGRAIAAFAIADTLRANAAQSIQQLKRRVRVVMVTGDRRTTADAIARQAGIDEVIAEVLPDAKVAAVRQLQRAGRVVVMVGDGINDAPALAQADVGIAMASGTDIAANAADVTLMRSDLHGVVQALQLARNTMATMKQNLFWAFAYNVIGIPIAAGALYPAFDVLLNPIMASAAMAFSSVSVVVNSLRLRHTRLS